MEEVNIYNTSQDNNSSLNYDYKDYSSDYAQAAFIVRVVTIIIISIGLPLTLVAIFAVYSLVKDDHVAPIYVINLLITDFIQLCCMIVWVLPVDWILRGGLIPLSIYYYCLMASVGFMVCIALERYLVIACPLWYRFRRTIKVSVLVCVVVWALPAVISLVFLIADKYAPIIAGIILLLPFPLFIFFLGGTLKALSASISVHSDEKRRIVGILVLVLLIYMLLFLPSIIWLLAEQDRFYNNTLNHLSFVFLKLSPLADLFLYIFMRKGTIDKLLASVCCCRMDSDDVSSPV